MTTFFWSEEICTYKYRCNLCVGVTVKFIKYFEDYLDKMELKGIVIMSTKKLTSWRWDELYWYFSIYIQTFFHHIFFQVLYEHKLTNLYYLCMRWLGCLEKITWPFWLKPPIYCGYQSWLSPLCSLSVFFVCLNLFCFSQHIFQILLFSSSSFPGL